MKESGRPLLRLPNTCRAFYGGFGELHPFQRQAIGPVLDGSDLVLQSATGSGKTEAVLAPCMERVIQSGREDAVLYVVPTRALAVDLERRLTPVVVDRLGLLLGIRTGDLKRAGGGRPDLILTTPESLDVLAGSSNAEVQCFLQRTRTVIIDEVHPLLRQYRGRQLSYVLRRLERRVGRPLQKIAVSATIADVEAVISFFGLDSRAVRLISSVHRDVAPHLVHLKDEEEELIALLDDLHDRWGYRKILMFANSRGRCDRLFALASRHGCFRDVAGLHYSNLKARERRSVEERFRSRERALCIATSTLELGIDVGDVDGVILFDPPDSATAFLQRIGRSNRRQRSTHFWGICRGERAGEHLLRFLGLLAMARRGVVEVPLPNSFPSVLVQQILSCLYQRKRISLDAMEGLFPECGRDLETIFPVMEKRGWLRRDGFMAARESAFSGDACHPGHGKLSLFRGGWRYRESLLDRRIWSNFPETEEDYVLEISGEPIADLPRSIVRQLEPGDRVHLAGKRIRVLQIVDSGERKRVLAEPSAQCDDKKLLWLGPGFQVSFEVAQSMRAVAGPLDGETDGADLGLFDRTRRLLWKERDRRARMATLANGIEVLREFGGLYRYQTFLGSMGNLILRLAIEENPEGFDGLYVASDEIAVACSHRIDFRTLSLPEDRKGFRRWVKTHFRLLRVLLPLNAFADALPNVLLVEELTDFLFDARVAEVFSRCLKLPSEIVSGDPGALDLVPEEAGSRAGVFLQPAACAPLLALEKERLGIGREDPAPVSEISAGHTPRSLFGIAIGEYMRHGQCERWLSCHFLPPSRRLSGKGRGDRAPGTAVSDRQHRERAVALLADTGASLVSIDETDDLGRRRSMKARFKETLDRLASMVSGLDSGKYGCLLNGVLRVPALMAGCFDPGISSCSAERAGDESFSAVDAANPCPLPFDGRGAGGSPAAAASVHSLLCRIDGVGLPDLIRVSARAGNPLLETGDIVDGFGPLLDRKWRTAFHALLLKECIRAGALPANAEVSGAGFLITRGGMGTSDPVMLSFDLEPFMAAFPAIFQNVGDVFLNPPERSAYRLDTRCTSCPCFNTCYRQALREEDVQFLPAVTRGTLWKLRQTGLSTVEEAGKMAFKSSDPFGPQERERLSGCLEAFTGNAIRLRKSKTRLFPRNLSAAVFVHLSTDPASGAPRTLGWLAVDEAGSRTCAASWTIAEEADAPATYRAFSEGLLTFWKKSIRNGKGPHLFHFGAKALWKLQEWAKVAGDPDGLSFLWDASGSRSTDLRRLLQECFDFPAPGRLALYAAGRILGFISGQETESSGDTGVRSPESLLHDDPDPFASHVDWSRDAGVRENGARHIESVLELEAKIWQWTREHVTSEFEKTEWGDGSGDGNSPAKRYLHFLEEEKRLREEDVLSLQNLSLAERVERFRAMGPLVFTGTSLDEEGRFLYDFKIPPGGAASRFREDDFLKLAPVGSADLQSGFPVVLSRYRPGDDGLSVSSRQGALALNERLTCSLEEDLTDWNHPRLVHVVRTVLGGERSHSAVELLSGGWSADFDPERFVRMRSLLEGIGGASTLNPAQRKALELPFRKRLSLIEGPPGTGKTHLLGWIVVALLLEARQSGNPIRIAVSALTHRAIDGVLRKVAGLANEALSKDFPLSLVKWGRWSEKPPEGTAENETFGSETFRVHPLDNPEDARESSCLVLGATGFGLYRLFKGHTGDFPRVFDWIVFDEASQVLVPEALLSLVHGKGNYVFLGDVKQLPPVILGKRPKPDGPEFVASQGGDGGAGSSRSGSASPIADPGRSILAHLLDRYGPEHRVRLDESYRMNEDLCVFPSRMWYDGALRAAPGPQARSRLDLSTGLSLPDASAAACVDLRDGSLMDKILDPEKPVVLVLADHRGCHQRSDLEAGIVARLAFRLMTRYGLSPDRMALVSPHRAQNNAVSDSLRGYLGADRAALPTIDTVERVQGSERDAILFSATSSDPDFMMGDFLNNPNRFNVAITRAKCKLIVVGSREFFLTVPGDEEALRANRCFKEFLRFCRSRESLFVWK